MRCYDEVATRAVHPAPALSVDLFPVGANGALVESGGTRRPLYVSYSRTQVVAVFFTDWF